MWLREAPRRTGATLGGVSQFEAKNLAAIKAALDQHNAEWPRPGELDPAQPGSTTTSSGWESSCAGLPVLADERVPTKRVRIDCDWLGLRASRTRWRRPSPREQPATQPMVIPVGPSREDDPTAAGR